MAKSCDYCVAVASAALFFLPSLLLLLHCAAAAGTVHTVGDDSGWIVPSTNPQLYTNWASSNTFHLNDVLTFNFATGRHDVVQVPKESFDSCNTTNQIGETLTNGPANVTLNQTGTHYFICAVPTHCQGGQKLAVTVSSTAPGPSPDASSPSSNPQTPPPPPSSAGPPPAPGPSPDATSPSSNPQTPPPPPSSAGPPPAIAGASFFVLLSFALGKLVL